MNKVRKVTINDVNELQNISRETFADTFGAENKPENLNQYLDNAYDTEKLQQEIANPNSEFYFAYIDGQLAGYLKLNVGSAQSEKMGDDYLEVQRIYLKKNFKRHGLGTELVNLAVQRAQAYGKPKIWLGVWEHNDGGLKFYQKMGFKQISDHVFQLGRSSQRDLIMEKPISVNIK